MLFRARNYSSICEGISVLFGVDFENIFEYLHGIYFEERENAIKELVVRYIKTHITDIEFYHLSRSFSRHTVLYPLDQLLLEESELSLFFLRHHIEFRKSGENAISMFFNGLETENDIIDSHFLLGKRFTSDMCICGFQILENIDRYKPGYLFDILSQSPEIVQSVDETLHLNGALIEDFNKNSKYYCEIGTVPFSEVGFYKGDSWEIPPSADCVYKEQVYVSKIISYAFSKYLHPNFNPIENALIYCEKPIKITDRVQPKDIWPEGQF